MNDRMRVLTQINNLTDRHCERCEQKHELLRIGGESGLNKHCMHECPVGQQLRELGEELSQTVRVRKEEKVIMLIKDQQKNESVITTGPDKTIFLQHIAAGNSIAATEKIMGIRPNAIYAWLKKWELTGIKPEKACDLLEQSADPVQSPTTTGELPTESQELLRDKNLDSRESPEIEIIRVKNAEIERLTKRMKDYEHQSVSGWAEVERLQEELAKVTRERNLLYDERVSLQAKLDAASGYAEGIPTEQPTIAQSAPINHPASYPGSNIECIDAIEAATTGLTGGQAYATGAAIESIWQWATTGDAEILHKAIWHIERLIAGLK